MTTLPRAIAAHPAGTWPAAEAADSVTLDYDTRHRRRIRLATDGGAALLLDLPKAVALAEGCGLELAGGGFVAVRAAEEPLLEVRAGSSHALLRLAWHIGNRHVPAEIAPDWIRIRPDHVIADMIRGLGGEVSECAAPFQPESGAYAGQDARGHDASSHAHAHGP